MRRRPVLIATLAALQAGRPLNACPYGATRPLSRRAWIVGYVAAARAAGAPLPEDAELEVDAADV